MKAPAQNSITGTIARSGNFHTAIAKPIRPAKKTGVLTVPRSSCGIADRTSLPDFVRSSSAARSCVEVSENSGSPVTMKSVATQPSGPIAVSAA